MTRGTESGPYGNDLSLASITLAIFTMNAHVQSEIWLFSCVFEDLFLTHPKKHEVLDKDEKIKK